jgi:hypothetical protein
MVITIKIKNSQFSFLSLLAVFNNGMCYLDDSTQIRYAWIYVSDIFHGDHQPKYEHPFERNDIFFRNLR